MALDITREELRADILEITTTVVQENNHKLMKMIDEGLYATNHRIDNLSRRMNKRFKEMDHRLDGVEHRLDGVEESVAELSGKIDFTHKLLHVHVANPSAHSKR